MTEEEKSTFSKEITVERIKSILEHCEQLRNEPILGSWDEVVLASKPALKPAFDALKPVYDKYMEFSSWSIKTEDFKNIFDAATVISILIHHNLIHQVYSVFVDGKIMEERWDLLTTMCDTLGVENLDAKKAEVVIFYRRTDYEKYLPPSIKEAKANGS